MTMEKTGPSRGDPNSECCMGEGLREISESQNYSCSASVDDLIANATDDEADVIRDVLERMGRKA